MNPIETKQEAIAKLQEVFKLAKEPNLSFKGHPYNHNELSMFSQNYIVANKVEYVEANIMFNFIMLLLADVVDEGTSNSIIIATLLQVKHKKLLKIIDSIMEDNMSLLQDGAYNDLFPGFHYDKLTQEINHKGLLTILIKMKKSKSFFDKSLQMLIMFKLLKEI